MKSKTSFFNAGLIISNFKRYGWASILWCVLLFLAVPFSLMSKSDTLTEPTSFSFSSDPYRCLVTNFGGMFSGLMLCIFPVLIGVLVFRYLHSPKASTMLHGLPLTRPRLFCSSLLSGLVLTLLPLLINGFITAVILLSSPISQLIPFDTALLWLANSLCIAVVCFSLAVFVGMFTGNLAAHFAFTYIIHFLPYCMCLTVFELLSSLVFGFAYPTMPRFLTAFPMMQIDSNSCDYNIFYIISAIVLLVLAYIAYRKRPSESAGDIVVFKFIRPIFKYGVTFCMAVVGYVFTVSATNASGGLALFLLFALIGYCLSQMLISKSWRILKYWKGFVCAAIIFAALWGCIEYDLTGYEKYIPSTDSIESVTFTLPVFEHENFVESSDKDAIEALTKFHAKIISTPNYNESHTPFARYGNFGRICYRTTDGREIVRSYNYNTKDFADELGSLYNTAAVRRTLFPFIYKGTVSCDKVEIIMFGDYSASFSVTAKSDIDALVSAYKSDTENDKSFFEHYTSNGIIGHMDIYVPFAESNTDPLGATIDVNGTNRTTYTTYSHSIQNSYSTTIALIKQLSEKYPASY